MRHFFTRRVPPVSRILLVESGSRSLFEDLIPGLRSSWGNDVPVDLVTCYNGLPEGFSSKTTTVYHVSDYRGRPGRARLYKELAAKRYSIVGIICSAEPIMTKWKWAVAAHVPAKVFVLNENGDYFWIDYSHWRVMRHFALYRTGLAEAGAVRTLARLLLFPFTLLYLLLYAASAHASRAFRKAF
ncbi:MAG: hypothetical protein WD696_06980 [Bryobacteraceae bacterium]